LRVAPSPLKRQKADLFRSFCALPCLDSSFLPLHIDFIAFISRLACSRPFYCGKDGLFWGEKVEKGGYYDFFLWIGCKKGLTKNQ